jgi:hypothetical protein
MAAEAATCAAHAVLAARGQWVTNEKRILALSGIDDLDEILCSSVHADTPALVRALRDRCTRAMDDAVTV